jgi:small subunit ribosomal protein S18
MANQYDNDDFDEDRRGGRGGKGGNGGDRGDRGGGGDRGGRGGFGRRKMCRFCAEPATAIDYKNPALLKNFITDRGKMVPRRISGTCAKHQRAIALAVRRARMIALVPHTVTGK